MEAARREKLSGGSQKSYMAVARRVIRRPPEREELSGGRHKQKSYPAAATNRRVIRRPPETEELSGGRQKSSEGQSKII